MLLGCCGACKTRAAETRLDRKERSTDHQNKWIEIDPSIYCLDTSTAWHQTTAVIIFIIRRCHREDNRKQEEGENTSGEQNTVAQQDHRRKDRSTPPTGQHCLDDSFFASPLHLHQHPRTHTRTPTLIHSHPHPHSSIRIESLSVLSGSGRSDPAIACNRRSNRLERHSRVSCPTRTNIAHTQSFHSQLRIAT